MILYLDMDGVLAAFDERVAELGYQDTREDVHKCMRTPGFFRDLDLLPGAKDAVAALHAILPGRISILSAVTNKDPEYAEVFRQEKKEWLDKHFPELASAAKIVTDKGTVGTEDDILVDDHPDWNGAENFPGTVIKFSGPADWAKVIAEAQRRKDTMVKASRLFKA